MECKNISKYINSVNIEILCKKIKKRRIELNDKGINEDDEDIKKWIKEIESIKNDE